MLVGTCGRHGGPGPQIHMDPQQTTFAGISLAGAGGGAGAAGVSGAVPAGIVLEFGAIVVVFDGTGPDAAP